MADSISPGTRQVLFGALQAALAAGMVGGAGLAWSVSEDVAVIKAQRASEKDARAALVVRLDKLDEKLDALDRVLIRLEALTEREARERRKERSE